MLYTKTLKQGIQNMLFALCGMVVGGVGVYMVIDPSHPHEHTQVRERDTHFQYISPLLECEMYPGAKNPQLALLRHDVAKEVEQLLATNEVAFISVYFRDLTNGPWFGIEEDADFTPASLVKVPVMIAVYKQSELEPGLLQRVIRTPSAEYLQTIPQNVSDVQLQPDTEYTVEALVQHMIKYSDNAASSLLMTIISMNMLKNVFSAIGVPFEVQHNDLMLSVKEYSAFFRILYNASFLSRENSERALKLLAESNYTSGLTTGVPPEVRVAHKFGERKNPTDTSNQIQLHDCGIVYNAARPYLLCVMTRGDNLFSQEKVIQHISSVIYNGARLQ